MHQRTLFQSKVGLAVALFAAVGVAMPAAAQSGGEPPAMLDVGVVRLIPGMTAEFEALQKERVAMYKSEDYKGSRQVYQTVRGNNHEYRVITPLNKYGEGGMHLTPEAPTYSMRAHGGLPADAGGV